MLRSAMSYLAASDATAMAAETQAQCLLGLEQLDAIETAARAAILAAFTAGQGYAADAIRLAGPSLPLDVGVSKDIPAVIRHAVILRDQHCRWVEAYERAASQGRVADLRLLHRPIDHRRWGESSWLNYWQGRDEGLWAAAAGHTGHEGPGTSTISTSHRLRVLGGSDEPA